MLDKEKTFIDKVTDYEKKFSNKDLVPRPPHWSGWRILPKEVEFWLDGEGRIHERLVYLKKIVSGKKNYFTLKKIYLN